MSSKLAAPFFILFLVLALGTNIQASHAIGPAFPVPGSSSVPLLLPPPGHAVLKDPSGTYNFTYLGNRQYSTDLATYQRLLKDPYSGTVSRVQIAGTTVVMTTPEENQSASVPNANSLNWSGAGGGYCSFSITGSGYTQQANCNNPTDTLYYVSVSTSSLTWDGHCWNRSTSTGCETFFWAGLSPTNTGGSYLVQNGICVVYYDIYCQVGSSGHMNWAMWWEILPTWTSIQTLSQYPTTINGTSEIYTALFYYSPTQVTFQWNVGSWVYSLTVNAGINQNNFVQAEGIFEQPTYQGYYVFPMVTWSPSTATMTGKYIGVNHAPNYAYIDTSYPSWTSAVYYQVNSNYYLEASGVPLGSTTFPDTWFCGPQHC